MKCEVCGKNIWFWQEAYQFVHSESIMVKGIPYSIKINDWTHQSCVVSKIKNIKLI